MILRPATVTYLLLCLFGTTTTALITHPYAFLRAHTTITETTSRQSSTFNFITPFPTRPPPKQISTRFSSPRDYIDINDPNDKDDDKNKDDDDDDDEDEIDPYTLSASSEFKSSATNLDWGSALSTLRQRVGDIEAGKTGTADILFRSMTRDKPNEAITKFVTEANPEVVAAMSGAVNSLLGGLSNPGSGVETIVKSSNEKLGSLCFQLMMTGYMFRNAEYVLALKDLMDLNPGTATLSEYKKAFDQLDNDNSGYIEASEVDALLADVYGGKPPKFEVQTFMRFFDKNKDGKVSWQEFEKGLGAMKVASKFGGGGMSLPAMEDDDEEDEEENLFSEPTISGKIEVELEDGRTIEVEAKDYINNLKKEAQALKEALDHEKGINPPKNKSQSSPLQGVLSSSSSSSSSSNVPKAQGIGTYIASLGEDVRSLTEGISPEVVNAMKLLVDFVLEGSGGGGSSVKEGKQMEKKGEVEMEVPGAALQQLALWQLVLGYRLRESEATGDYRRMIDS